MGGKRRLSNAALADLVQWHDQQQRALDWLRIRDAITRAEWDERSRALLAELAARGAVLDARFHRAQRRQDRKNRERRARAR